MKHHPFADGHIMGTFIGLFSKKMCDIFLEIIPLNEKRMVLCGGEKIDL